MPWWAITYLVLFVIGVFAGMYLSAREGERRLFLILDSLACMTFSYLFAAFWLQDLRALLGWFAPLVFLLAIGWEIADTPRELRGIRSDPELSGMEKQFAPLFGIGIALPAYLLAGVAAFR